MLPIQPLSMRMWATMFPPSSATAIFMGWPISLAFFSAALITRRASSNFTAVMGAPFMFYAAAPDRANFALVNKVTEKGAVLRLSAFAAACFYLRSAASAALASGTTASKKAWLWPRNRPEFTRPVAAATAPAVLVLRGLMTEQR